MCMVGGGRVDECSTPSFSILDSTYIHTYMHTYISHIPERRYSGTTRDNRVF